MDDVSVAELMNLLSTAVACGEVASDNLRFDFFNLQQRVCVGLFRAIVEYARAIHLVASNDMYYAYSTMNRAALDAFVDIKIACKKPSYCESLMLADAEPWLRVLEKASVGTNALFAPITESANLAEGRRMYKRIIEKLQAKGVKTLSAAKRYKLAEMDDEYDAAYKTLSAEAHNNISFVTSHYFDVRASRPALRPRGSRPGNGAPRATALIMTEIVLNAADMVLQLCGHGTAMMAPTRTGLEQIRARLA